MVRFCLPGASSIPCLSACAIIAASGALAIAAQPSAEPVIRRPTAAQRILRVFDFEEMGINDFGVPLWWHVAQHDPPHRERPGYPIWNMPTLDFTVAAAGHGSVRLPVRGGSVALRLDHGVAPIFPGADYGVSARVQTTGLREARARLTARMLDQHGQVIAPSEVSSALVRSEGQWTTIGVTVMGLHDEAAFLQVELEVLQPEHFRVEPDGDLAIRRQDFDGAAWFDDVTIAQVARVELEAVEPSHVFIAPGRPELSLSIRDLSGERLFADLRVLDVFGGEVDHIRYELAGGQSRRVWTPRISKLGWYRAETVIRTDEGVLAKAATTFSWANPPPPARSPDGGPQFALWIDRPDPALDAALPDLAERLGADEVILPLPADAPRDTPRDIERMRAMLAGLFDRWKTVTLAIPSVPIDLARQEHLDPSDVTAYLVRSPRSWGQVYQPMLDRFGQRVLRWQIGAPGDDLIARDAAARSHLAGAHALVRELAPGARVIAPWSIFDEPPRNTLPDLEWIAVAPATLTPEGVGHAVGAWRSQAQRPLTLIVESLDPAIFGNEAVAADIIQRVAAVWRHHEVDRSDAPQLTIAVPAPWDPRGVRRARPEPHVAAPIWRTVIGQFRGRIYVGEWAIAPGLRCLMLAPRQGTGAGAALVLWREAAPTEEVTLSVLLATEPVRITDAFGNARGLAPSVVGSSTLHTLTVGADPIFIEDIDLDLVQFQASVQMAPGPLRSLNRPQDRRIILRNPWQSQVSGRFFIVSPGGLTESSVRDRTWDIAPRSGAFSIPAGGVYEIPLAISFSPMEQTGPIDIILDVELSGVQEYGLLALRVPTAITVDEFSVDLLVRPSPRPGGPDLVIEAAVANLSDTTLDLEIALFAGAEFGRLGSVISNLEPDQTALRRFPLRGAGRNPQGREVFVSVLDRATGVRLNRSVRLE
ncbi:MAG: hypothetical protein KIT24_09245 [Phycisphaeraceae bacterium]|nr:hypothetical protein [Phycisphaeraceae bacterium]